MTQRRHHGRLRDHDGGPDRGVRVVSAQLDEQRGRGDLAGEANISNSGFVVNAASAALFLYINGHGSSIFRDGQRLVLITFLLSAALWAQVDFITTVIDARATMSCQIGIIFNTLFDQLARFSIEQYLLWAINSGTKPGASQMIMQTIVGGRFVLGMVFVGLSRPLADPICLPRSSVLPVAIVVVAVDAAIILSLTWMAFSAGLVRHVRGHEEAAPRSKSILLVILGFAIWTGVSLLCAGLQSRC